MIIIQNNYRLNTGYCLQAGISEKGYELISSYLMIGLTDSLLKTISSGIRGVALWVKLPPATPASHMSPS